MTILELWLSKTPIAHESSWLTVGLIILTTSDSSDVLARISVVASCTLFLDWLGLTFLGRLMTWLLCAWSCTFSPREGNFF
ncbi:unnamed protein product [Caenorhabditis nigoni]